MSATIAVEHSFAGGRSHPLALSEWRARRALRRCDEVGVRVQLFGRPVIENLGHMTLGSDVHIRSAPAATHLVTGHRGRLIVGDRVRIAHGCGIAAHESVTIGADASVGAYCLIMDTDFHESRDRQAASTAMAVSIGPRARIGAGVTILRGSDIGADAVVGAGSVVSGTIAPSTHVVGVPARRIGGGSYTDIAQSTSTRDAVLLVFQRTFGLSESPSLHATPDDIEAWDSLGMLNLLISLEETFGVQLSLHSLYSVRTVASVIELVQESLAGGMRPRPG